jgi:hypothetical protein
MADTKISALEAISTIATDDVLPIVDTSETATKNITVAQLTGQFNAPFLMQSDSTDQAIAATNAAQVITFDTDVYHSGITRTSASRFTIPTAGTYLICFNGITSCPTTGKIIEVWLRVNGVDVAASNTIYTYKGTNTTAIVAVSFLQTFTANQYFEFWTWGDDTGCKWDATAAGVTPTRPACPSIIITCNRISN